MEKVNDRRFLLKLEPDGSMYLAEFSDIGGEDTELSALQEIVAGYIEHVPKPEEVRGQCIFYVNEEGLLNKLSPNFVATKLCNRFIVGNLCVAHGDSPETFFTREEAEEMAMELYEILMKKMTADVEGGEADEEAEQGEA